MIRHEQIIFRQISFADFDYNYHPSLAVCRFLCPYVHRYQKLWKKFTYIDSIFPVEWCKCRSNTPLVDHDLDFQGQFWRFSFLPNILQMERESKHNDCYHIRCQEFSSEWCHCECCTLSFDQHFKGHEFWNVNISKMVRPSKICWSMTFIEVVLHDLDLLFDCQKCKMLISQKYFAVANKWLRNLHLITLT